MFAMVARIPLKAAFWLAAVALAGCHTLNPFAADLGRVSVNDKDVRPPYLSLFGYLGYLAPAAAEAPSSVYFWLPQSTPELGVRFVSGRPGQIRPDSSRDVVEAAYAAHRSDSAWFDPAIEVQRCLTALDLLDVPKSCAQWVTLGDNDDSPEMPKDPEGKRTNSLVRIGTHPEDPLKSLTRGLYRVNIRAAKNGTPQGTFLLQLGAPVLFDQVAMARTPQGLSEALAAQAQHLSDAPAIGHTGTLAPVGGTAAPLEPAASGNG
jgi:hypothetical protein